MTKKEFIAASKVPRPTLERWLRNGEFTPAATDDKGKPMFAESQIVEAQAKHRPKNKPADVTPLTVETYEPESALVAEQPLTAKTEAELVDEIKHFMTQAVQSVFEAGRRLIEMKRRVGHGHWQDWLKENFGRGYRTATNYMEIAEKFGGAEKVQTFADLSYSALLELKTFANADDAEKFLQKQADEGRPVERQKIRELKRNVAAHKREVNGEYVNVTGNPDNNAVVEELNQGSTPNPPEAPLPFNGTTPAPDDSHGEDSTTESAKKLPPIAHNRNSTLNWYTPSRIVEAARKVLGTIDLDPASNAYANETVKATKIFTADDDGLLQDWFGHVWLNPPFANGLIDRFVDKLLAEINVGHVEEAIFICDNATETLWFRKLADNCAAIVFTTGRINFLREGTFKAGNPTRGQCILYFGSDADKFFATFSPFGWACRPLPVERGKDLFTEETESRQK